MEKQISQHVKKFQALYEVAIKHNIDYFGYGINSDDHTDINCNDAPSIQNQIFHGVVAKLRQQHGDAAIDFTETMIFYQNQEDSE